MWNDCAAKNSANSVAHLESTQRHRFFYHIIVIGEYSLVDFAVEDLGRIMITAMLLTQTSGETTRDTNSVTL